MFPVVGAAWIAYDLGDPVPEAFMSSSIPRRFFVTRLAASAAAFSATSALACAPSAPSAAASSTPPNELESWLASFKAPNKCIYDCVQAPGASDGILFARNLLTLSNEKLGTKDADTGVIVSFRHFATPFGYNDAMWAKYPPFAALLKFDDPKTKKPALRNVPLHDEVEGFSDASIPGLNARGVSFTVCGAATAFIAGMLAGKTGDAKAIEAELGANLVPGARLVPAGVVVVQRAQRAGFAYTFAG
jgi:intracellular sulfur oxidation DsrE/DsrF family protein